MRLAALQKLYFEAHIMPQAQKKSIDIAAPRTVEQITPEIAVPPDRLLRLGEVLEIVGLSRASVYALMKKGTFPQNRKVSVAAARWRSSEINSWMAGLKTGGQ